MALKDLEALFRSMGLQRFDAEVYSALLSRGPMTITELVKELGRHRPQVYEALERLKARGLVEYSGGKPALYRAVEPEVLLSLFDEEVRSLRERAEQYLKGLRREPSKVSEYGVWIFRSYKGLMKRFGVTISLQKNGLTSI